VKKVITKDFGERLNELRIDNNYSMIAFCELYNERFNGSLNKGTLSKYENGLQEPLYTTVKRLAELFDVGINYMIGEDD